MKKFLTKTVRNFVIYVLIAVLGLPLSIFFGSASLASAAAKTKKATDQNVSAAAVASATDTIVEKDAEPVINTQPEIVPVKFIGDVTGLFRANSYVTGQSITLDVTLTGAPLAVWAQTGVLDSSFPETINFENYGNGKWHLNTPALTDNLNEGSHILKIYAQDANDKTIKTSVKINLSEFQAVKVSSYKVNGEGSVDIVWKNVPWADAYLVNWQIQNDNLSNLFEEVRVAKITIENLKPGTFYEVRLQPLRGDAVGKTTRLYFKTLQPTPVKVDQAVAGQSQVFAATPPTITITPTIGEGVATTTKPKIAAGADIPFRPETVKPTQSPEAVKSPENPSPSPSEEPKTETGGWNKLLLALSILIIATAVAIGGYYAYEKLMSKSKDKNPDEPDSSSRW